MGLRPRSSSLLVRLYDTFLVGAPPIGEPAAYRTMAEHLASIFGTGESLIALCIAALCADICHPAPPEKDRVNCPFFLKIGACRCASQRSLLQQASGAAVPASALFPPPEP